MPSFRSNVAWVCRSAWNGMGGQARTGDDRLEAADQVGRVDRGAVGRGELEVALAGLLASALLTTGVTAQGATPEATPDTAVVGQATISPVYWFPGTFWAGTSVPDSFSTLVTFDEGASVALETLGLEPGPRLRCVGRLQPS
jgi:hypothetical protein